MRGVNHFGLMQQAGFDWLSDQRDEGGQNQGSIHRRGRHRLHWQSQVADSGV